MLNFWQVTFYDTKLLNFWHHQYWCSKKIGKVASFYFNAFSKVALVHEHWGLSSESSVFIYFPLFLKATIFVQIFFVLFFSLIFSPTWEVMRAFACKLLCNCVFSRVSWHYSWPSQKLSKNANKRHCSRPTVLFIIKNYFGKVFLVISFQFLAK